MQRYFWEYAHPENDEWEETCPDCGTDFDVEHRYVSEHTFSIFDRMLGTDQAIAHVFDLQLAERIVAALNLSEMAINT